MVSYTQKFGGTMCRTKLEILSVILTEEWSVLLPYLVLLVNELHIHE